MKSTFKGWCLVALLISFNVEVNAADYYGQLPSCISNFQYPEYDHFVGSKNLTFTWTPNGATANDKLYYYVADEEDASWVTLYQYWYRYTNSDDYQFAHVDLGPWSKTGHEYSEENTDDNGIAKLKCYNPILCGRSVKWDDQTTGRIQSVSLTAGELDFGTISKSKCVFFMFRDKDGNNYYGPDKQTNSEMAAKRHYTYSTLPWNGCWMSVNLNIPMPVKVSISSSQDGDYTEVAAGSDVSFTDNVWVKLELNNDFLKVLKSSNISSSGSYGIRYTTNSLQVYNYNQSTPDYVDHGGRAFYYDYNSPFQISKNTVLRYAVTSDDDGIHSFSTLAGAQEPVANFETMMGTGFIYDINTEMRSYEEGRYSDSEISDDDMPRLFDLPVPPIEAPLRANYLWGNTFIKSGTATKTLSFSNPIPYSSWSEYLTGRYGLGSGAYTYQTWVADDDYLIPMSLEGILDVFIVNRSDLINDAGNYNGTFLSRINWVPKGMPVVVRYRNRSINPATEAQTAVIDAAYNSSGTLASILAQMQNGYYDDFGYFDTSGGEVYDNNQVLDANGKNIQIYYDDADEPVGAPSQGSYDHTETYYDSSHNPVTLYFDSNGEQVRPQKTYSYEDLINQNSQSVRAYYDVDTSGSIGADYFPGYSSTESIYSDDLGDNLTVYYDAQGNSMKPNGDYYYSNASYEDAYKKYENGAGVQSLETILGSGSNIIKPALEFASPCEAQTFTVYAGDNTQCQYLPEYNDYHLDKKSNYDYFNFYNYLYALTEDTPVGDVGSNVYGLTVHHTNDWIATCEPFYPSIPSLGFLQSVLYYSNQLPDDLPDYYPVIDDWMLWAGNNDDGHVYGYYYGYGKDDESKAVPAKDNSSSNLFLYGAAWKKVVSGNVKAGKAFLRISNGTASANEHPIGRDGRAQWDTNSAKMFLGSIGGLSLDNMMENPVTTGIVNVNENENENANTVYDLMGRRVYGNMPKGVYIKNGRKVVVK